MQKKIYTSTTLSCVLQQVEEIPSNQCLNGVISKIDEGFRFEEIVPEKRPARNPKLFDGLFVSMVRHRDGKYQIHLKTMKKDFDKETFAFNVYNEISNALQMLD